MGRTHYWSFSASVSRLRMIRDELSANSIPRSDELSRWFDDVYTAREASMVKAVHPPPSHPSTDSARPTRDVIHDAEALLATLGRDADTVADAVTRDRGTARKAEPVEQLALVDDRRAVEVDVTVSPRYVLLMKALALLGLALAGTQAVAQTPAASTRNMGGGNCDANPYNCVDAPNPLPAPNTVWLEEMTWMDVRDAMAAGKTTVIIPTGGIEPNGPWLALGKHNYVLRANCDAIARALGNALCAPIVPFVPEGRIESRSGHMGSPGTLSMREETFRALLTDIVHSLKVHGFKNIILIGDSGGNQPGQRAVADSLTALWRGEPVVAHVQEYYDYAGAIKHMETRGLGGGKSDGLHDDPVISLNMYATDPRSIRWAERVKAGKATIDGISIADSTRNRAFVREIVAYRTSTTVDAIRKAIANKGTLPPRQSPR